MTDILTAWRCGEVRRWHCHPDHRLRESGDTTAAHTHRVMGLAMDLFPSLGLYAGDLFRAIRLHDLGEAQACGGTGDVPLPFKDANPDAAAAMAMQEVAALRSIGLEAPPLEDTEACIIRLCDKLDAYLWMLARAPDLRVLAGWQADRGAIDHLARDLGVLGPVRLVLSQAGAD